MSDEALYVAASGAIVQEMRLEVLSNNLANINTFGFKEDKTAFSNYIPSDQNRDTFPYQDGAPEVEPETLFPYLESNTQVTFEGSITNFSQGQIKQTGNALDLALEGNGFFCVRSDQGLEQYTRKGNFILDSEGKLVTQDGLPVLGRNGGDIEIPGEHVMIDEEGNISVGENTVASLKIIAFSEFHHLNKAGDCLFVPTEDAAAMEIEPGGVKIRQGCLELSNVNSIRVMTEIIEVHRAYEAYQKIIRTLDETVSQSISGVGGS